MKLIIKRDLWYLFSKKNYFFLGILLLMLTIPLVYAHGVESNSFLTILGMNAEIFDKRYVMWLLIPNFYFIWIINTLFWNDLKYSYEFIWLRMSSRKWFFIKIFSILISLIVLYSIILIISNICFYLFFSTAISISIKEILFSLCIHFSIGLLVIAGTCYFSKVTIYITALYYAVVSILKLDLVIPIFTTSILKEPSLLIVPLIIIFISYLMIERKIVTLTERRYLND